MAFMFKAQRAMGSLNVELKKGHLKIRKTEETTTRTAGMLIKRKLEGGDWKERWCVLKGKEHCWWR